MEWFRTLLTPKVQPRPRPVITTAFLISEALDIGLISENEIHEIFAKSRCFPKNWAKYNPNLYLQNKLSPVDRTRFFVALMRFHMLPYSATPYDICVRQIMYLPKRGHEYRNLIKLVASNGS
jgi:hypothetical protein